MATFLLTCLVDPDAIIAQQRRTGASTLQLCDRVAPEVYPRLRVALPGIRLVQVVHVTGPASLDEALAAATFADALLLDSGRPDLPVKELGGTGRVHDWTVSARIREAAPIPVFLAGGLTPENVRLAAQEVRPFGLDLCSGVRRGGRLDERLLASFFRALEET